MQKNAFFGLLLLTLAGCGERMVPDQTEYSLVRSLTGSSFKGKKLYLGWGAAGGGDPAMMHNEVKYDVLHTHDIFTQQVGGNYTGTKEIGTHVTGSLVQQNWQRLGQGMTKDDMYVQYSSGHGSPQGLGVGVSYNQIRDNALAYPAKEIIILTMACHSGGLVDAFKQKQAELDKMKADGRTLFVLSSSTVQELSSTGPGTDAQQAGGPQGSAGSAFGHALWKSLIGHSDGEVDGVKDGFIDLAEVEAYTKRRTIEIAGHHPVSVSVNASRLIMNEVPNATWVAQQTGSSETATDAEIRAAALDLDEELSVN